MKLLLKPPPPIPESILTKSETRKLRMLQKNHDVLGKKLGKAMAVHVNCSRKMGDTMRCRKLADKGFKYEFQAFKAAIKLGDYKNSLRNKYKLTK